MLARLGHEAVMSDNLKHVSTFAHLIIILLALVSTKTRLSLIHVWVFLWYLSSHKLHASTIAVHIILHKYNRSNEYCQNNNDTTRCGKGSEVYTGRQKPCGWWNLLWNSRIKSKDMMILIYLKPQQTNGLWLLLHNTKVDVRLRGPHSGMETQANFHYART